ncbi:GntR family transcriptional regulator [Ornithinimicrobium flavum]|uniref:GntR family transcriptional regulator n=1 Tax=Ornithinimicrobium flavum TaxID=1288636 RepID=UPI00106FA97E|nr:GntR family transcriptional regulator [Ornithinimicrobium flavum]
MPVTTSADLRPVDGELSLAQSAYLQLRERLVMLDIPPGAPLQEQGLATELGVGRTPLREAIKRLEVERFVETFPRRGTFATRVDPTALAEISEVRQALEPLAARRAARWVDASGRHLLDAVGADLERLHDHATPRDHMAMDVRVHQVVYSLARNSHLEASLTHYLFLAMRIWSVAVRRLDAVADHIAEHQHILTAVREGDEEEAARLMVDHMDNFETAIRRVL